jgi:NAD(P)-dependent dehydrogenase (short-subunit alcohol dehydrogenase family)
MSLDGWFGLQGQGAVVTGAGSGLGRAIARGLAAAGAGVLCADIDAATAEETAASIRAAGGRAVSLRVDVAAEADARAMVDRAVAEFGQLDAIFNNAGINGPSTPLHEVSLEEWNQVLAVDLTSVFLGAREAARVMIPRGRGKIVNTASVWGLVGATFKPQPVYTAAKGGVVNLTRELALEYAPHGIQVNAMAPLGFATNIAGGATFRIPELRERLRAQIPLGRIPEPEEIQGLALFLASRASDYVTGAIIPIDGGFLAR